MSTLGNDRTRLILAAWACFSPALASSNPPAAGPALISSTELKERLLSGTDLAMPVARVADEVITVADLGRAISAAHQDRTGAAPDKAIDFAPVLGRLIDTRLFLVEARTMGIDQLPAVKKSIDDWAIVSARDLVVARALEGALADPKEVEALYEQATRRWKLKSALFAKEEEAKRLALGLKGGKPFEELAKAAVAEKWLKTLDEAEVGLDKALPQIAEALLKLAKPGDVSAPITVPQGVVIFKLDAVTHVDDPAARKEAERICLERARGMAESKLLEGLRKKHARIDEKLLGSLDFEAKKPGFAALAKDKRVIVRIKGADPMTVGDLATAIALRFFHGMDAPIRDKRVNVEKDGVFVKSLRKLLLTKAAKDQKIAEAPEFLRELADHRNGVIFDTFVQRAIMPDVKVPEADGQAYYEKHKGEYSSAEMIRLDSVAFAKAADAQAALKRVRSGTDFGWLKANAAGRLEPDQRAQAIDGQLFTSTGLAPEVAKVITGAKAGDYRLYASPEGQHYLLLVKERMAPKAKPYLEVRPEIGKKLAGEHLEKAMKEWAGKLRKAHDVHVYVAMGG